MKRAKYLYASASRIVHFKKFFISLLNSGKNRLKQNSVVGAYSELKLAYAIRPDSKELNQFIIETLNILCGKNIMYCDALDKHYKKTIKPYLGLCYIFQFKL